MDHNKEFDGIGQADNPMPEWWKLIFGLAFVFAVIYSIYFHLFSQWKMEASFKNEVTEYDKMYPMAKEIVSVDGSNPFRDNPEAIAEGKKTFMSICIACHGPEAKGIPGADGKPLIGPNLTDNEWLHADNDADLYKLVMEGVPVEKTKTGKGPMPPHKASLGSERVYQVLAWVASINPKLKKLRGQ